MKLHSESSASLRRGKIACLPASIRLQINLRLDDGLQADQILPWLNDLPEVRQITQDRFDGIPISPQNLSAWRQGGFQEWLIHRQLFDTAAHVHEQLGDFMDLFNCVNHDQTALKLADMMLTQLTIRFTTVMAQWTGGAPDPQTSAMLKIGQFIIKLQQAIYRGQRQAAELPAIRHRVKHEVQADLRNQIQSELIIEQLRAAKSEPKRKSTAPTPPRESSPIKPNQASTPQPKESANTLPSAETPSIPPIASVSSVP